MHRYNIKLKIKKKIRLNVYFCYLLVTLYRRPRVERCAGFPCLISGQVGRRIEKFQHRIRGMADRPPLLDFDDD